MTSRSDLQAAGVLVADLINLEKWLVGCDLYECRWTGAEWAVGQPVSLPGKIAGFLCSPALGAWIEIAGQRVGRVVLGEEAIRWCPRLAKPGENGQWSWYPSPATVLAIIERSA